MADVVTLEASLKLLDEVSPSIGDMEKALAGLEKALGVSRAQVGNYRQSLAEMTEVGRLSEEAMKRLGITVEEFNDVLSNNKAMEKAAQDMERMQVSAIQMNKAFNDAAQQSGMAMSRMHDEAIQMDKGMGKASGGAMALQVAMGNLLGDAIQNTAGKVKGFFEESANLAVKLEMLINVSRNLGESQGYTAKQIDDMADSIAKLGITSIKSRESINKMVQAGLDLSQATKLARLAQDAGTIGNINSSEAMGRLIHGITTMQTETLRTVGININASAAVAAYAKELGKSKDALTAAEKQQAFFNGVLKEGEKIVGSYETRLGTAGGQQLSLVRIQEEAQVSIGNFLKPLKELEVQMETVFWKNVQKYPEAFTILGVALTTVAGGMTLAAFAATTFGVSTMAAAGAATAWVVAASPVIAVLAAITAALYVGYEAWKTYQAIQESAGKLEEGNAAYVAQAQALADLHPEWGFLAKEIDTTAEALAVYQKNQAMTNKAMEDGTKAAKEQAAAQQKLQDSFFAGVNKGAGITDAAMKEAGIDRLRKELAAERELAEAAEKREKARKLLKREKTEIVTDEEAAMVLKAEEDIKKLEKAQKSAASAADEHAKKIKTLADSLSGGKAQKGLDDMAEALERMGGVGEVENLPELAEKIIKLQDAGGKATPELERLAQAYRDTAATMAENEKAWIDAGVATQKFNEMTGKIDTKKFNDLKFSLDSLFADATAGMNQEDIGISAVGAIPEGEVEKMAEMFQKAKDQGFELSKAQELVIQRWEEMRAATQRAADETEAWGTAGVQTANEFGRALKGSVMDAISKLPGTILDAIKGGGNVAKAVGTMFGQTIGDTIGKKAGEALSGLGKKLGGKLGSLVGGLAGPLSGLVSPLLGAIGGKIGGLIGGLFGGAKKKALAEAKNLRDEFLKQAGGIEAFKKKADEAGISLDKFFAAKNKGELQAAIDQVNQGLDALAEKTRVSEEAQGALQSAMDKYGISVEQLGPKFAQQGLDKVGLELLQNFKLLTAAGADVSLVTEKMSEDMSKYVQDTIKAGATIPEAMRPAIQAMIDQGKLVDENGDAITSMADAGITFGVTMEEAVMKTVEAIDKLVAALTGVAIDIPVNVHQEGNVNTGGGGGGRPEDPGFASGTGGFRDFGQGTRVTLHGPEVVATPDGLRNAIAELMGWSGGSRGNTGVAGGNVNTVVNMQISENPMQTAETQEQMRRFTLETVDREIARSLADAIANGKA